MSRLTLRDYDFVLPVSGGDEGWRSCARVCLISAWTDARFVPNHLAIDPLGCPHPERFVAGHAGAFGRAPQNYFPTAPSNTLASSLTGATRTSTAGRHGAVDTVAEPEKSMTTRCSASRRIATARVRHASCSRAPLLDTWGGERPTGRVWPSPSRGSGARPNSCSRRSTGTWSTIAAAGLRLTTTSALRRLRAGRRHKCARTSGGPRLSRASRASSRTRRKARAGTSARRAARRPRSRAHAPLLPSFTKDNGRLASEAARAPPSRTTEPSEPREGNYRRLSRPREGIFRRPMRLLASLRGLPAH